MGWTGIKRQDIQRCRICRVFALLCAWVLFLPLLLPVIKAKAAVEPALLPDTGPPPFAAYPALDSQGFLALEWLEDEFVFMDEPGGRWVYISPDLRVEIERFSLNRQRQKLVWFIADIRFRGTQAFRAFMADPRKPSTAQARPADIARRDKVVYAQNGDLFSWRRYQKQTIGLIIRDGKIIHEKTYTHAVASIPPLDELALYPDGHIEMRFPGELSARDYLDRV